MSKNIFSKIIFITASWTAVSSAVQAAEITTSSGPAASKKLLRRPPRAPGTYTFTYGNPGWNNSSTSIDNAIILVADKNSGKKVQVVLEETGPDSSNFSGVFSLDWGGAFKADPEFDIYIPPQEIFKDSASGFKKLEALIAAQKLKPKPIFRHAGEQGEMVVDIFDTKEQVQAARENTKEAREARDARAAIALKEKMEAAKALLEAEQFAKLEAEKKRLAEESAKREAERLRLAQIEKQKEEERIAKLKAMAEGERKKRKADAEKAAAKAMQLYAASNFVEAEKYFAQAVELDPVNNSYYYAYGITLYRNDKYNQSIVTLNSAGAHSANSIEREFYLGLNYYKLKEYNRAVQVFQKIEKSNDPNLGPSAVFYMGIIEFDQLHYEQAKPYFEKVLEISKDPRMDDKAEDYIEKIERILYFARNKAKKFIFNLDLGLQYDSNILLVSDSTPDSSKPSQLGDIRYVAGFGAQWRPVYEKTTEFSLKARADTLYTRTSSLSSADPLAYSFGAPFTYKGMLFGKGWKMDVKPGYEILYLDANSTGTKSDYLDSVTGDFSNALVMNESWFSTYNLKMRSDKGATNSLLNATKFSLNFNNMYFKTKKKNQGFISDLTLAKNTAEGSAYSYNRVDVGLMYMAPFLIKDTQMVTGGTVFWADYPDSANSSTGTAKRTDQDYAALFSVSKTLNSWLSTSFSATYTINSSTVETYTYKKYTVGITLSSEFSL